MSIRFKLFVAAIALGFGTGSAHAQGDAPALSPPGGAGDNPATRNGGDTSDRDATAARDAAARQRGPQPAPQPRGSRAVPASPDDVSIGLEVRDPKGVVVGTIDSVSMGSAVIMAAGGKVEVPLEAFGKNNKGLLIPMSKAEFDKAVAEANEAN